MPRTLYYQDIRCVTEGCGVSRWVESEQLLTACPNDAQHEILPGSARILDQIGENIVHISKESGFQTNGHIRYESYPFEVAPGGTLTTTTTGDSGGTPGP